MIGCFFDDVDNVLPQMCAALETGNLVEVGRLGHRMKGTLLYLGAQPAEEAAQDVERFCKSSGGTPAEAEEAVNALEHECTLLKAALVKHPLAAEAKCRRLRTGESINVRHDRAPAVGRIRVQSLLWSCETGERWKIKSRSGEGTTIIVELPVVEQE